MLDWDSWDFLFNEAAQRWLELLILESGKSLYVCIVYFFVWLLNIVWSTVRLSGTCVCMHTGESVIMCCAVLWQVNVESKISEAASHQPVILDISQSAWYSYLSLFSFFFFFHRKKKSVVLPFVYHTSNEVPRVTSQKCLKLEFTYYLCHSKKRWMSQYKATSEM